MDLSINSEKEHNYTNAYFTEPSVFTKACCNLNCNGLHDQKYMLYLGTGSILARHLGPVPYYNTH